MRLGRVTESGGYAVLYTFSGVLNNTAALSTFDSNGATTWVANWNANFNTAAQYARPVINVLGEVFNVEGAVNNAYLTKRNASGTVIWSRWIGNASFWTVGPDQFGGVHVASDNGALSRYDFDGNPVWTNIAPM